MSSYIASSTDDPVTPSSEVPTVEVKEINASSSTDDPVTPSSEVPTVEEVKEINTSSSTDDPVIPSTELPTVEEMKELNINDLNEFLKRKLKNINSHIDSLTAQEVDGEAFLTLTLEGLKVFGLPLGASTKIINLLNVIQGEIPSDDTDDMKSLIEKIENKLGDIYEISAHEISARHEISKTHGSHYASKFDVFDVYGLIRLALPRKQLLSEHAIYNSQLYTSIFRAEKLTNFIYNKRMRDNLEKSIEYISKLPSNKNYYNNLKELAKKANRAIKEWTKFEVTAKSAENRLYLSNTPELSVMLMTAYVLDADLAIQNKQAPFNCRLDIDVRGRTSGTDITNIAVELGEIKSSNVNKTIKKGYRQLLLRLAVLSYIIEACFGDEYSETCSKTCSGKETPEFHLFGKIYVPEAPPNFDVPEEWKEGINFSRSAKFHMDVVTIGEK